MKNLPYRKNVVAIVRSGDRFLLVHLYHWEYGMWKFPQGGVDKFETPMKALERELQEELETQNFEIRKKLPVTRQYLWDRETIKKAGNRWKGQKQQFYLVELPNRIKIKNKEIQSYMWVKKNVLLKKIDCTHPIFKGYKKAIIKCLKNL